MKQKNIFQLFLLIGSTIILIFCSCSKTITDHECSSEFVYINQTDHTLQFEARDTIRTIIPQSTNNVFTVVGFGSKRSVDKASDVSDALNDRFLNGGDEKVNLCIDNNCIVVEQKGLTQGANYVCEDLGNGWIRYTYTFTNDEINELLE